MTRGWSSRERASVPVKRTWLVVAATAAIVLSACQPAATSPSAATNEPAASAPPASQPATTDLAGKRLCISSIVEIQVLNILYDDMKSAALNSGNNLEITVKNQNGDIAKQIEDIDQFIASGECAAVATVTSVSPETAAGWERSASDAAAKGIGFYNFSSDYITGATQNISNPHYDAGYPLGVQAGNWYKASGSTGVVGTLSNVVSPGLATRTTGFVDGFKSVVGDGAQIFDAGSGNTASDGAAAAGSLLQAHPDISVLFVWGADAPTGAIQAAAEAGKTDPKTFSVWTVEVSDAQINEIVAGTSVLQGGAPVPFRFCAIAWERSVEWRLLGKDIPPTGSCLPFGITRENGPEYLRASNNQFLPEWNKYFDTSMIYFKTPVKTGDPFPKPADGFNWKGANTTPAADVDVSFP